MSDLKARFESAVAATKTLTGRPGFTDLVARAKYDAWASLRGTAPEAAMQSYIDQVAALQA